MITHLEELCFWLFLVNAGSAQQDWFRSLYFKTWAFGSVLAGTYMPLVTIFTRSDPLKCEAYTFLAGSLGSLSLTLWFTPILWTFPSFLANLRREGVDTATVVRLTKFHELNTLRIIFRFAFTIPLVILGIDGVRPHQHINESMFWTDLLAMIAAFGCVVSSGITLVIFFPRSVEAEIAARDLAREKKKKGSVGRFTVPKTMSQAHSINGGGSYLLTDSPTKGAFNRHDSIGKQMFEDNEQEMSPLSMQKVWADESRDGLIPPSAIPMRPNRRSDVEMGSLTEANVSEHNLRTSNVNHLVHTFTSPIDLVYGPGASAPRPNEAQKRYTFSRN